MVFVKGLDISCAYFVASPPTFHSSLWGNELPSGNSSPQVITHQITHHLSSTAFSGTSLTSWRGTPTHAKFTSERTNRQVLTNGDSKHLGSSSPHLSLQEKILRNSHSAWLFRGSQQDWAPAAQGGDRMNNILLYWFSLFLYLSQLPTPVPWDHVPNNYLVWGSDFWGRPD